MEEWRPIKEFPNYEVSNRGNVRNIKFDRSLSIKPNSKGYPRASLNNRGKRTHKNVHKLIADAFLSCGDLEPNHKDGNKTNNNIENLECLTSSENVLHAYRTGLKKPSGPHPIRPVRIIETGEVFESASDAARFVNGDHSTVSKVLRGENRTHKGYHYEYLEE